MQFYPYLSLHNLQFISVTFKYRLDPQIQPYLTFETKVKLLIHVKQVIWLQLKQYWLNSEEQVEQKLVEVTKYGEEQ